MNTLQDYISESLLDSTPENYDVIKDFFPNGVITREGAKRCFDGIEDIIIPEGITWIKQTSFEGWPIKSVVLPASLQGTGAFVFNNCARLEKVVFTNGCPDLHILEGGIFGSCKKLEKIELPKYLEAICYSAFYGSGIKDIVWPKTLKEIGRNSFTKTPIKTLDLSSTMVEVIGADAFNNSYLEEVILPSSIKILQRGAFENCQKLKEVKSVGKVDLEVGIEAFASCKNLRFFNAKGRIALGGDSFDSCDKLRQITTTITQIEGNCFRESGIQDITISRDCKVDEDTIINSHLQNVYIEKGSKDVGVLITVFFPRNGVNINYI